MNTVSDTPRRYTATAMALHWLLALALVGIFCFGLYMTSLPFSPARLKYFNWHKWAGMTILILSALRLLWRITHRPPALPHAVEAAMGRRVGAAELLSLAAPGATGLSRPHPVDPDVAIDRI